MTLRVRAVRRRVALGTLALLVGASAVYGTTQISAQAVAAKHATVKVAIKNYSFKPKTVTIHLGDIVVFTNHDNTAHTVTADHSKVKGLSSKTLNQNSIFKFTAKAAGKYSYHCAFHPFMMGTIVVKGK